MPSHSLRVLRFFSPLACGWLLAEPDDRAHAFDNNFAELRELSHDQPGYDSNPLLVTVTNSGNANLNISSVVIGGSNPSDFTTRIHAAEQSAPRARVPSR